VPSAQPHRTILLGAYHEALQQRRRDQQSEEFRLQMHQRNAIEGTISELVRSHGLRRARYKGFAKVDLQNLLIAAACNIKRWFRKLLGTVFGAQKEDLGLSGAFPWSVLADFFVQIDPWSFPERRGRGRDTSYPVPPAQIPASGTTAPGSYLELWRAKKRSSGQGCRTLGCGSQRVTWRCIFFQVSFRL
jgi:hypothetical protein